MSRRLTVCAAALTGAALLFACGWLAGSGHASAKGRDKLNGANVRAALWESTATGQQGAIAYFQRHARQQKADLANVRFIADAALDNRDALQIKYDALRKQQQNANTKAAHENPDCADLTRPLCPAVAERLFRPSGGDASGDH